MTPSSLILPFVVAEDPQDLAISELCESMGVPCELVDTGEFMWRIENEPPKNMALALSCRVILALVSEAGQVDKLKQFLRQVPCFVLVYGLYYDDQVGAALSALTDGAITHIGTFERVDLDYQVTPSHPGICGELSGLSFGPIKSAVDLWFDRGPGLDRIDNLISVGDRPLFVRIEVGASQLFLLGCSQTKGPKTELRQVMAARNVFTQTIAPIMFFKYVFGDKCWHLPGKQAALIIDDPPLRPRYGFLDYRNLLEVMDEHNFATTIAFIPWNCKRNRKQVTDLFQERPERFSVCVHGCDHTQAEFAVNDYDHALHLANLALERMRVFRDTTGVGWDPVMVFPQGKFSGEAMRALRASNFLAAVNTTPVSQELPLSLDSQECSFLEPAVLNYDGLPLFTRRYPEAWKDLLLDLFLNKPAFMVIHHQNLKGEYAALLGAIDSINASAKGIQWQGLGAAIKKTYLQRVNSDGSMDIKPYASKVLLENSSDLERPFHIHVDRSRYATVQVARTGGDDLSLHLDQNSSVFTIRVPSKTAATVEIPYGDAAEESRGAHGFATNGLKVAARRYLSEFRDNYLSRSEFLSRAVSFIMSSLRN